MFTEYKTDEFPTPQEFYWPEIRLRLDAWDKYRKQKSRDKTTSTGSEQFKRETKEKIKEIFSIQGLCARPICRARTIRTGAAKGGSQCITHIPRIGNLQNTIAQSFSKLTTQVMGQTNRRWNI